MLLGVYWDSDQSMREISSGVQLESIPDAIQLLVLEISIAGQTYAIRADGVQKVLAIAAWTVQAGLTEHVVGILRLEDQKLAVVDARVCLGFETRLPKIQDQLLLVQTTTAFFIWLDCVNDLRDWKETDTLLNLEIFDPAVNP